MQPEMILIVDDEATIRSLCQHVLQDAGYECCTAANTYQAKGMLAQHPISLVLTDLKMPGESGIMLLKYIQANWVSVATIVLTGSADIPTAIEAVHLGAYDYICKPFKTAELPLRIRMALEKRQLVLENQHYHQQLEAKVTEQTQEIRELYRRESERAAELENALRDVQQAHLQAQEALLAALGLRDCETRGHCRRVMQYSSLLAKALKLSTEETLYIERGALLHDIGKLGIPDAILYKPSQLDKEEWALMRKHTIQGASMIAGIEFLKPASPVVLFHHEHYDGTGYPYGLQGDEIPLEARIFAVADALDAITSKRPYKDAVSFEEAVAEIQRSKGSHFDPAIVDVFSTIPTEQWKIIRDKVKEEIQCTDNDNLQYGLSYESPHQGSPGP